MCYHAVTEVQKEENMCPRYVWHRRRRLAAGKKERMWCALKAVLPEEEHMLAINRTCGRRGPILVLDTDFGGAAHGTVRWIRKEGVSMEVLRVRRKDMKEYKMAGLHHAEFYRDTRVGEWGVYPWMMRRARGQEDRTLWSRRMRKMWNEWVPLWGIQKRKPRCGRGGGAQQGGVVLDRGERGKPDRAYRCVRRSDSKGGGGRYRVRPGSGMKSMRICSGKTTSQKGQDRGTSAGGAPRRRGKSRGQSYE